MTLDGINILLPMGGLGTRFQRAGYRFPKPLVNIAGRAMILWVLDNLSVNWQSDVIYVALPVAIDNDFRLSSLLRKEYPSACIKVIHLDFTTRGAAETLYAMLSRMDSAALDRKTISLDCDSIYFSDVLTQFRRLPPNSHASFYFHDSGDAACFSYILMDDSGRVSRIEEKRAISRNANTGAYGFSSARVLMDATRSVLDVGTPSSGEYYSSQILQNMIADGHHVVGLPVADFSCVGTPEQLADFFRQLKLRPYLMKKMRVCFDVFDTLLLPCPSGRNGFVANKENVAILTDMKFFGHTILLYTCPLSSNINSTSDSGPSLLEVLAECNIPFDELHCNKPTADAFVDDLAVHSSLDTEREIGWLTGNSVTSYQVVDHVNNHHVTAPSDSDESAFPNSVSAFSLTGSGALTPFCLTRIIRQVLLSDVRGKVSVPYLSNVEQPLEAMSLTKRKTSARDTRPSKLSACDRVFSNENMSLFESVGVLDVARALHSHARSLADFSCMSVMPCDSYSLKHIGVVLDGSLVIGKCSAGDACEFRSQLWRASRLMSSLHEALYGCESSSGKSYQQRLYGAAISAISSACPEMDIGNVFLNSLMLLLRSVLTATGALRKERAIVTRAAFSRLNTVGYVTNARGVF
jgi:dTDP-glucose pyrophosphorylase